MTPSKQTRDRLRQAASDYAEALVDALAAAAPVPVAPDPRDLSIIELAEAFGKRPSTVRAWVERGYFPGAFKLRGKNGTGREWRIPKAGIDAFRKRQQEEGPQWWRFA